MEQKTTTAQKQYKVSKQTAAIMDCLQELNNLTANLQDVATAYSSRNIDAVMKPINEAADKLQQVIIHTLLAESVAEAAGHNEITEV